MLFCVITQKKWHGEKNAIVNTIDSFCVTNVVNLKLTGCKPVTVPILSRYTGVKLF